MADDDTDVPETGAVFTFGKSRFADNVPNKFWIRNDRVLQVACGDEHTALVAESGRIFTFGANDWGQLGLGHSKPATKPSCIKSLKKENVRIAACGRSFTLVATESGKVYSFGANGEGQCGLGHTETSVNAPQVIEALDNIEIKMLSAGTDHSAALTVDGDVYVWGGGGEGQLGLGSSETEVPKPTRLELDEKIVCLSCGYYHTALVTESGKLLTFGEADSGKLGLAEPEGDTATPQEVTGITGKVTWVSCGGSHTVAVTDDGKIYTFGDGSNGQLGHGTIQLSCDSPLQVTTLKKQKIKWASCGENHTAAISVKGAMFTFGDGRHGKLGLGEENFANQFKPSKVTRFEKFMVEAVSCGGCHMLVLAKPRMENGDWASSSDQSEADEDVTSQRPRPGVLDALRRSEDMDLSGSFSARDRRRGKQDPMGSLNRTLPPLNSSFTGRSMNQPLMSNGTANNSNHSNAHKQPVLGVVKIEDVSEVHSAKPKPRFGDRDRRNVEREGYQENAGSKDESEDDSSLGSVTQDSEENSESDRKKQREALKDECSERLESDTKEEVEESLDSRINRPKPLPRITREKKPSKKESEESYSSSSPSSSSDESVEEQKKTVRKKPIPVNRRKPSPSGGKEAHDSAEEKESPDREEKKKVKKKKIKKKAKDSGNEEDSGEEEKSKKKKKNVAKQSKDKKKAAGAGGLFGRKKILDSEEEEGSELEGDSDKDSSDEKSAVKNDKKKEDKKSIEKDESDKEETDNEEDSKKKVKIKDLDDDKEEVDAKDKDDEKDETKAKPEKKSKFCVIL